MTTQEMKKKSAGKLMGLKFPPQVLTGRGVTGKPLAIRIDLETWAQLKHAQTYCEKILNLKVSQSVLIRRAIASSISEYDEALRFSRKCKDWELESLIQEERGYMRTKANPSATTYELPCVSRFESFPTFDERARAQREIGRKDFQAWLLHSLK